MTRTWQWRGSGRWRQRGWGSRSAMACMLAAMCAVWPTASRAQLIVAHRGASAVAPENTLPAFLHAWQLGADAVEGDFYLTRDRQIVCIHDETTKRTAGIELGVSESTWPELRMLDVGQWKGSAYRGTRMPRLEDVLAAVPGDKKIFVEIKCGPEILEELRSTVQAAKVDYHQIAIISFNADVVAAAKRILPQVSAHWLVGFKQSKATGRWSPEWAEIERELNRIKADGIDCQGRREVLTTAFAERARRAGKELHVWTIDDPDDAAYYQRLGVDSITTNRPKLVRQAVERERARPELRAQPAMQLSSDLRLRPITIRSEWEMRRQTIIAAMQDVMGRFPTAARRCPLAVQVKEETDCGTYVRRLITYESEPGCRVPAYLTLPKRRKSDSTPVPAVLCLHPTDQRVGHQVVHGLAGRSGRQYAKELSELGYVTLAPAYPLLANYHPDLQQLGYVSGTMKAIWDNHRGIDLLLSIPHVEQTGVAAIGHSLGGHNALYTAVFDDRIKVVITSCGFDSFVDYKQGDIRGWTSERYMPRLLPYRDHLDHVPFDFPELIACLAPRPIFINAPSDDSNFDATSVGKVWQQARPIYDLLGAPEQVQIVHPKCGHNFPETIRQQAYRMIARTLGRGLFARGDSGRN